jgi:Ca-activated chloride channel family protein
VCRRDHISLYLTLGVATLLGQDHDAIFKSDTQLVVVHATVVDKNGKPISDIPQSAFRIFEDNTEQKLQRFRREDAPVSLGVVIDRSGSMRNKSGAVADASLALIKASNPLDEVFIAHFNENATIDQTFTNDIPTLEKALRNVDSRGNTGMYDALAMAIGYVQRHATKDKKALLIVTDGNDTASRVTLSQVVREARRTEVLIYCIGLLNQEDRRDRITAKRALSSLAEASGGLDYYPRDINEVRKITPQVAYEIRNQYMLAYSPLNRNLDGTFRQIRVTVSGFGSAVIRTRDGYYAPRN